jgi:hypothetical protein
VTGSERSDRPSGGAAVEPFTLRFALSRRQRLAVELPPWLPAVAGTTGFGLGALYAGLFASPWFLLLLLLPPIMYRGLFAFAFELVACGGRPVEMIADGGELEVRSAGLAQQLPLDGIFQVYRSGDTWTVLHLDGSVLTIPADAITAEQIEYLKSFARRAAAARAEPQS